MSGDKITLGVSSCLLGEKVRYDGGHKLDLFIRETLGRFVDYVPVCPEVECGLPVPREAMHLVGQPESPRLVTIKTGLDHTERMLSWGRNRVGELENENLCGFIFKSKSPSSGMERVRIYGRNGSATKSGVGIWARLFMNHFPLLPVEEDGRLHDPLLREMFVERIFVMKRWRETMIDRPTLGRLVDFHTRHKLLVMSHSPEIYRVLGRLTATAKGRPIQDVSQEYLTLLAKALALKTTIKKNVNVLQHIAGYFKKQLDRQDKEELGELLHAYKQGLIPLIVPVTLLNHYVRRYDQPYLKDQYYLNPHPLELKLRNHV
jgi:uncharacterized protein YbgA (DUF1722 family)/uncharacterized protein YbbK (DUF523 family)